jgi:hypothetical protein
VIAVVQDLLPGNTVRLGGQSAIFIGRSDHPKNPNFQLVIWKLDDGTWSLDALSDTQEVGEVEDETDEERWEAIREVFRE